jgi:predicted GNAT family acetyltransferase
MSDQNAAFVVTHNTASSRFEAGTGADLAVCDYTLDGDRVVFTHTFVPPTLRGRGIAEQLARAALAWARSENKKVVPACSYIATFIARHREFQPLVE